MIQYKVVDKRRKSGSVISSAFQLVDGFFEEFMTEMANEVIKLSPVDTGTYVTSHNITNENRASEQPTESSHGKPKGQSSQSMKSRAASKLAGQINKLDPNKPVYFSNESIHAKFVEYGSAKNPSMERAVYRTARGRTDLIASKAFRKVGATK